MPTGSSDSERGWVDTNIFAYAQDLREPVKRPSALGLIERLTTEERPVVSTQVINELCLILVRGRLGAFVGESDLRALIVEISASTDVIPLDLEVTTQAVRGVFEFGLSWYDALIWSAAKVGGCSVVYAEDLPGKSLIDGIRYENPFDVPP